MHLNCGKIWANAANTLKTWGELRLFLQCQSGPITNNVALNDTVSAPRVNFNHSVCLLVQDPR